MRRMMRGLAFAAVVGLAAAAGHEGAAGQTVTAPINDLMANAIKIPPTLRTIVGDTRGAGPIEPGGRKYDVDGSVWYSFRTGHEACKALITIPGPYSYSGGAPADNQLRSPVITVYQPRSYATPIRRIIQASPFPREQGYLDVWGVFLSTKPNANYLIRVHSRIGKPGAFRLNIDRTPPIGLGVTLPFLGDRADVFKFKALGPIVEETPQNGSTPWLRFNYFNATESNLLVRITSDIPGYTQIQGAYSGICCFDSKSGMERTINTQSAHAGQAGYFRHSMTVETLLRSASGDVIGPLNTEVFPIHVYRYAPDPAVKLEVTLPQTGTLNGALGKPIVVQVTAVNTGGVTAKQCSLILDDLPVEGEWRTRSDLGVTGTEPVDIPGGSRMRFEYLLKPAMVGALPEGRAIVRCVNTNRVISADTFQILAARR